MTLLARKPRPLVRDKGSFRDDRLFILACDDTYAPAQYFSLYKIPRVQVHVVPTTDGTSAAEHVLERLLDVKHEEYDERWLVLDVDHCASGAHIRGFSAALARARTLGVNVALSKPNFEFWLALHHVESERLTGVTSAKDSEDALRGILGGSYNKTRLNGENFPLASVPLACARAEALDRTVDGGDIPLANTSRVYLIWRNMVASALPSQLPAELHTLVPPA